MVRANNYTLDFSNRNTSSASREKSREFIRKYGLWDPHERDRLIESTTVEEFCHTMQAPDDPLLYVFCMERSLRAPMHEPEIVQVYLKEREKHRQGRSTGLLVVSLHALEKPIVRLFED